MWKRRFSRTPVSSTWTCGGCTRPSPLTGAIEMRATVRIVLGYARASTSQCSPVSRSFRLTLRSEARAEADQHDADDGVDDALDARLPEELARPRDDAEPQQRHRGEGEPEQQQTGEGVGELWQQAREEHGHLRIAEVADQPLPVRAAFPERGRLRRRAPKRSQQRLHSEED